MAQRVKNLPEMRDTWVQSLGQEYSLEKRMATHSSVLAWRILWTEEPGGLQSMASQSWAWLSDWAHTIHTEWHWINSGRQSFGWSSKVWEAVKARETWHTEPKGLQRHDLVTEQQQRREYHLAGVSVSAKHSRILGRVSLEGDLDLPQGCTMVSWLLLSSLCIPSSPE